MVHALPNRRHLGESPFAGVVCGAGQFDGDGDSIAGVGTCWQDGLVTDDAPL